jgi:hypothetical protein
MTIFVVGLIRNIAWHIQVQYKSLRQFLRAYQFLVLLVFKLTVAKGIDSFYYYNNYFFWCIKRRQKDWNKIMS